MNNPQHDNDEQHEDEGVDPWLGEVFEDPVSGESFEDYSAERDWDFRGASGRQGSLTL